MLAKAQPFYTTRFLSDHMTSIVIKNKFNSYS